MAVLIEYNIKLALCPYNILCCICRVFSDEVGKINEGGNKKLYRVTPIVIYLWPYKEKAASGYKLPAEQVYSQPRVQKTLYYTVLYMQHSMHVRILHIYTYACSCHRVSISRPPIVDHHGSTLKSGIISLHIYYIPIA